MVVRFAGTTQVRRLPLAEQVPGDVGHRGAEFLAQRLGLRIERYRLPNLLALNIVVVGLLGRGVAASTRLDPQAKALGEELRAAMADIPEHLLRQP